jgi:hypothetical protein
MISYKTLNKNDTILIKDIFDLEEALANKQGVEGYKYTVIDREDYSHITSSSRTDKHIITFYLNRSDDIEYILLYIPSLDLFTLYQQVPGINLGNRQDLLNQELYCFFNTPVDDDNFVPRDLDICEYPNFSFTYNKEIQVNYNSTKYETTVKSNSNDLTTFYYFEDKTENCNEKFKQFVIIEEGGIDHETLDINPEGGLMRLLVGRDINQSDIEIFDDGK